jgi:hypothetical protein
MSATVRKPRTRQLVIETEDGPLVYDGLVPLLPRHQVHLVTDMWDKVPRFRRLFRSAWGTLPLAARRTLLRHWRSYRVCFWGLSYSPSIQLIGAGFGRCEAVAACGRGGHELRFEAPALDAMPDGVASQLMVHELCHACLYAVGDPAHWDHVTESPLPAERAVRACLEAWGLGEAEDEVGEWLEDYGYLVEDARQD